MAVEINGMRIASVAGRIVNLEPIRPAGISVMIPEMVRVAGGTFSMGSTRWEDTQPIRQVTLKDFAIGKYPVTNGEYLGHLQVMGLKIPDLVANSAFAMHPVVNISWHGAMEYCTFLNELKIPRTDSEGFRKFSLPTEAQWEFAARGIEGREYPWGNESYEGRVNFNSSGTTPVNEFPLGATPNSDPDLRIFGMSGNVWEWVGDWYAEKYNPKDLIDPKGRDKGTYRVMRGGSWWNGSAVTVLAAYRGGSRPEDQGSAVGFRVAEDLF